MKKLKTINRKGEQVFLEEISTKKVRVWKEGSRKEIRQIHSNGFTFDGDVYDMDDFVDNFHAIK
jgi:hypothetical protein